MRRLHLALLLSIVLCACGLSPSQGEGAAETPEQTSTESIVLDPGKDSPFLIYGSFLDEQGEPTRGWVKARESHEDNSWVGEVGREEFVVHLRKPGVYRLEGVSRHGTGVIEAVRLTPEQPHVEVDLQMENGESIRGVVRDGEGEIAAGVPLFFLHFDEREEFDPSARVIRVSNWPFPKRVEPGGLTQRSVRTDEQGKFDIHGLQPGAYLVYAGRRNDSLSQSQHLAAPGLTAGDANVELVFHRPHIVVRLLDSQGEPLPQKRFSPPTYVREGERPWPAHPLPFCIAEDGTEMPPVRIRGRSAFDLIFEVKEGAVYRVGACGGTVHERTAEIRVPIGAGRIVHEIRCESLPIGTAEIAISRSDFAELNEAFQVRIEEVGSGVPLMMENYRRRETALVSVELPAGDYVLIVEGIEWVTKLGSRFDRPRRSGAFRAPLKIAPGVRSEVQAVLPALPVSEDSR